MNQQTGKIYLENWLKSLLNASKKNQVSFFRVVLTLFRATGFPKNIQQTNKNNMHLNIFNEYISSSFKVCDLEKVNYLDLNSQYLQGGMERVPSWTLPFWN